MLSVIMICHRIQARKCGLRKPKPCWRTQRRGWGRALCLTLSLPGPSRQPVTLLLVAPCHQTDAFESTKCAVAIDQAASKCNQKFHLALPLAERQPDMEYVLLNHSYLIKFEPSFSLKISFGLCSAIYWSFRIYSVHYDRTFSAIDRFYLDFVFILINSNNYVGYAD